MKVKKPTKFDILASANRRAHSHLHTTEITDRRNLLYYERVQVDNRIVQLVAAMTTARELRATIDAIIRGLDDALEARR